MIEKDAFGFFVTLLAMAGVTYLARIGGYWLIGRLVIGPRLRRMLNALPGAIIAATVAPVLVHGGVRAWFALGAAALVMILLRKDYLAVAAGVAIGAAGFAWGL